MITQTQILLTAHTNLMNEFGADSKEANEFLELQVHDQEFQELARTARALKIALLSREKQQ